LEDNELPSIGINLHKWMQRPEKYQVNFGVQHLQSPSITAMRNVLKGVIEERDVNGV
jgi:hypothetical protein